MAKLKNNKKPKSQLTPEQKKMGKMHIYLLLGMIVMGIAAALYSLQ